MYWENHPELPSDKGSNRSMDATRDIVRGPFAEWLTETRARKYKPHSSILFLHSKSYRLTGLFPGETPDEITSMHVFTFQQWVCNLCPLISVLNSNDPTPEHIPTNQSVFFRRVTGNKYIVLGLSLYKTWPFCRSKT